MKRERLIVKLNLRIRPTTGFLDIPAERGGGSSPLPLHRNIAATPLPEAIHFVFLNTTSAVFRIFFQKNLV